MIESGPFGTAYQITELATGTVRMAKIFKMDGADEYIAPLRWAKEANNLLKFCGDPHFFQLVDKFFEPDKKSLALVLEMV